MTHRTIAVRMLTAGVGFGAAAWFFTPASSPAQGPAGPAAWLRPATATPEPTARGADPDTLPFNSYYPAAQPTPPTTTAMTWSSTTMSPSTSLVPRPGVTAPPAKDEPSMLGRAWNGVKDTFSSTSTPPANGATAPKPQPNSSQGFVATQPLGAPTRPQPTAQGGPNQAAPRVYSAPPAYRWYGWGTTTPGQNTYAPDGQSYPNGSARWFVHTGATPGAFPTAGSPAMTQMVGGGEPPGYAGPPSTPMISSFQGSRVVTDQTPGVGPTATVTPPPSVAVVPTMTPAPPSVADVPTMTPSQPVMVTETLTANPPMRNAVAPEPVWQELNQVIPTVPANSAPATGEVSPRPLSPATEPEPNWQPAHVPMPTVEVQPVPMVTVIPIAANTVVPVKQNLAFAAPVTKPLTAPMEQVDPGWMSAMTHHPAETKPIVVQTSDASLPTSSSTVKNPVVHGTATLSEGALLDLERIVREACRSQATVLEIVPATQGRLTVRLIAPSEAMAAEAVKVVSQLPQLKPFTVDFEGKVFGK